MTSQKKQTILVILPSLQDKEELQLVGLQSHSFVYVEETKWKAYGGDLSRFDPLLFLQTVIESARQNTASAIFFSDDFANLISAIACDILGIVGPPVEAMFLANHKFYSRKTEGNAPRFVGLSIWGDAWKTVDFFPVHVKPTSLSFSLLQKTVYNKRELGIFVRLLRKKLPKWEVPFKNLFSKYISSDKFPLATDNLVLAEEFIVDASQHAVEGWSDSYGNHFFWALSDNNYFPGVSAPLDNNSFPSRLNFEDSQRAINAAFKKVSELHMKNSMWNVEMWIRKDGGVTITEINGRMCASMTTLYKRIMGKSQYPISLKLSMGLEVNYDVDGPVPVNQQVGGMFALISKKQGKVSELIDLKMFTQLTKNPQVVRIKLIYPEDTEISWRQVGGQICVARVYLIGESYDDIKSLADRIRIDVIKT